MNLLWSANNYDNGSCCGLRTGFNAFLYTPNGLVKTGAASMSADLTTNVALSATNRVYNGYTCVAFANLRNADTDADKIVNVHFDNRATSGTNMSWWCSNGLYNMRGAASDSNQNLK
jgi:hypothetical protein